MAVTRPKRSSALGLRSLVPRSSVLFNILSSANRSVMTRVAIRMPGKEKLNGCFCLVSPERFNPRLAVARGFSREP